MSDDLKRALLEIERELRSAGLHVYLAGGYGLYLKQMALLANDARTFIDRDAWPRPRATADLDVFVPSEIIVDFEHTVRFRGVLDQLGYSPVPSGRFMHFAKSTEGGELRVELLTGPVSPENTALVKINGVRVRPRQSVELHAYLTKEAIDLEEEPFRIPIDDAVLLLPNAFAFLLMKLHAFDDRKDRDPGDDERNLGRHHALDVYRLLAMLTEPEELFVRERITRRANSEPVQRAKRIVASNFASGEGLGVLRMREHSLAGDHLRIKQFLDLLNDLFEEEADSSPIR